MRKLRFLMAVMLAAVAVWLTGCEFYEEESSGSVWENSTGDTLKFGKQNSDGYRSFEFSLKVTDADGTEHDFTFREETFYGNPASTNNSVQIYGKHCQGFTQTGERIDFALYQELTSDRNDVDYLSVIIFGIHDKDGGWILEGKNSFGRPNAFENFDDKFYRID